jgi:hypothetical protein
MTDHNMRFGREPANAKDLHRQLTAADDLDEVLAWREVRARLLQVSQSSRVLIRCRYAGLPCRQSIRLDHRLRETSEAP